MARGEVDVRTVLGTVPLFAACSRSDLRLVARHTSLVEVPEGTALVEQGDKGDAFYVLLRGRATVERDGDEVDQIGPGDHLGELALLDPAPRNATVRTLEPSIVAVLAGPASLALLRETDGFAERLLASLARRLRELGARSLG